MTILLLIVLVLLSATVIGALLYYIAHERRRQARMVYHLRQDAQRQAHAIARMNANLNQSVRHMSQMTDAMEARQDRLRRSIDLRIEQMMQSNDRSLDQVRQVVSEKLDGRLNESFRLVNAQLANVHRGLGEMRELSMGVTDLKKMLGGVKTRGVWGEVQLRAIMEQMFAPTQYVENAAIPAGSQTRVEFALKLPTADGAELLLPIDSKFPQEDYLRLMEAADSGDRELVKRCAAQLERVVLEQARIIREKYVRPPETADFAVMFLPTESLYAEVARREALIERTQERFRVLISGPATFTALMTSLQMGFRSLTLEQRSGEVLKTLYGMRQDFTRFDASIQRMRQRLAQTSAELDTLESRARKVVRAIDNVDGAETALPEEQEEDHVF